MQGAQATIRSREVELSSVMPGFSAVTPMVNGLQDLDADPGLDSVLNAMQTRAHPLRTGNRSRRLLAMISTAIAVSIRPKMRVRMFNPSGPNNFPNIKSNAAFGRTIAG